MRLARQQAVREKYCCNCCETKGTHKFLSRSCPCPFLLLRRFRPPNRRTSTHDSRFAHARRPKASLLRILRATWGASCGGGGAVLSHADRLLVKRAFTLPTHSSSTTPCRRRSAVRHQRRRPAVLLFGCLAGRFRRAPPPAAPGPRILLESAMSFRIAALRFSFASNFLVTSPNLFPKSPQLVFSLLFSLLFLPTFFVLLSSHTSSRRWCDIGD